MEANQESDQLIDCRNAIRNIGLDDNKSCASVKCKTLTNEVDVKTTDSVPLQNGCHSLNSYKEVNQKNISNGNISENDDQMDNHLDQCSQNSVNKSNNNTISDNMNHSLNNDSEPIEVIEVMAEEHVISENNTEEEVDCNIIRTNAINDSNVINVCAESVEIVSENNFDSEMPELKNQKICQNVENGETNETNETNMNRYIGSVDLDFNGENSSFSESSSQQSQHSSSASQPTPNAFSSSAAVRPISAANSGNSFAIASQNSQLNDSTNVSSVSGIYKKKFGKFRILNDEQSVGSEEVCEPITHSEDSCNDSKLEREREKMTNSDTISENSEHSSVPSPSTTPNADITPNKTNKQTKRRGRPAGSTKKDKTSVQMAAQVLFDDEDLSRRRSSRLKTLEARKEQEKAVCTKQMDENSADSSIVINNDTNDSQQSVTDSSPNGKQKKKKSKKDKNKSKEKESESKKGNKRKKKLFANLDSNRMSCFDEQNPEKCKTYDIHKNLECFTPPLPPSHYQHIKSNSSLNPASNKNSDKNDFDDSSPKPEKVKSRWRRNSELESGHGFGGEHTKQSAQNVNVVIPKETEPPPHFDAIDENYYLFERKKSKSKKETRRMVCDCILTKEERTRGLIGCGDDCLNRMLMIECGSRCSLGDHCANKRFQKRHYAKVEPFRTAKKGWGLRALEPLQPNSFIMEYIGEVIDPLDFHNRTQKYSKEKRQHHYFMALKSDEIIDATVKGNITRFVNHSCDPNSETQKWTVNGELRIGFFTQRFVQAGEEITFDYQFQRYGKEAQKCYCEALNCRGYIGATETASIFTDGTRITPKQKQEIDEQEEDEEILEDLALEEEIAKLSESGGLRNRQQVLMLARLMVRAEDIVSRIKLIDIIKGTVEMAYLRLLLDYHGLQLIWSWMAECEDNELKAQILELLEILPIPNKTMLTDSKVYSVVERWSQQVDDDTTKPTDISNKISLEAVNATDEEIHSLEISNLNDELKVSDKLDNESEVLQNESELLSNESELLPKVAEEHPKIAEELPKIAEELPKIAEELPKIAEELPKITEESLEVSEKLQEIVEESIKIKEEVTDELMEVSESDATTEGVVCDSSSSDAVIVKTEEIEMNVEKTNEALDENCSLTETEEPNKTTVEVLKVENDIESSDENKEIVPNSNKSSPRIELKSSSLSLVIKPRSAGNASKPETPVPSVKPKLSIAAMAQRLLLNWKELKEVFRIPRLERQKRHEDEKEADRKTKEVEERRARGLPLSYDKRGVDDRDYTIAGILGIKRKGVKRNNDSKDIPNKKNSNPSSLLSSNWNKVSKEEHRKMFEMEVAQKDYQEALKRYHQQLAYYNAVYGHQIQAQQQQQQQYYSQESTVSVQEQQYSNAYTYDQYYQNYMQSSINYSVPVDSNTEHMSADMQLNSEVNPSVDETMIFSIETSPVLITLANSDCETVNEFESSLIIDNIPNESIVYSDSTPKTNSEKQVSIFDPIYPPPGIFYETPEGNKYFTPLPIDRNQKAINLVFDQNITLPSESNAVKSLSTNKLPPNWRHYSDQKGNVYYYNKTKHKSQWIAPEEERPVIVSPVIEVPIEVITDHKISDTEDSTPVPENPSLNASPKPEEVDEPIDSCPTVDSFTADSVNTEAENPINSAHNSPNLLQSILALEADPRKRRQLLNSVMPSTTTAAADTSSSANRKKTFASTRQIQEYFRNKMSEYVVHCLNPYRRPECKKGRILNNNDFKYLARKLTHTIMGKEIKQCKSLENLSCNEAVKHKTKDYVKKYMARFGPFYKTENNSEKMVSPKDIVTNDTND